MLLNVKRTERMRRPVIVMHNVSEMTKITLRRSIYVKYRSVKIEIMHYSVLNSSLRSDLSRKTHIILSPSFTLQSG